MIFPNFSVTCCSGALENMSHDPVEAQLSPVPVLRTHNLPESRQLDGTGGIMKLKRASTRA